MPVNFDIKNPEKLLKKIPFKKILSVITLIILFLLLTPDWILKELFILDIRNSTGTYLGITLIVCIAIWCVIFISYIIGKIQLIIAFSGKEAKNRFEQLSKDAIKVVLKMYQSSSHSMVMDMADATTVILENLRFIGRGTLSIRYQSFDYFLHPWVVKYLSKHFSEYKSILENE